MLSERDRAIMEAAELPVRQREEAALQLGMTSPRFHQILNRLVSNPSPELLAEFPGRVNRLRRVAEARRTARSLRTAGIDDG
ncbi:hypothetical protein GCM10027418_06290 [Mariniluteicoccus endophyticus]